jgi:hypothetical protein
LILDTLVRGVPKPRLVAARRNDCRRHSPTHPQCAHCHATVSRSRHAANSVNGNLPHRILFASRGLGFDFSVMPGTLCRGSVPSPARRRPRIWEHFWEQNFAKQPEIGAIQRDALDRIPILSRTFAILRYYENPGVTAHNFESQRSGTIVARRIRGLGVAGTVATGAVELHWGVTDDRHRRLVAHAP